MPVGTAGFVALDTSNAAPETPPVARAPEPEKETKPAELREYVMFGPDASAGEGEERWVVVGLVEEMTKAAARDEMYERLPEDERAGPFVTIAASAWIPQTAKEERDVKPGRVVIRRVWS